jgi:MFS family permease
VIGPLAAALLLWLGLSLRQVFFLAVVPGIVVVGIIGRFVKEPARTPTSSADSTPILRRWRDFGPGFWRLIGAVLIFTLGNSADAFLLLRFVDVGVSLIWVAVFWSLFSLVKMGANLAGGRLSDSVGRKRLVLAGWAVYALVYLGMALTSAIAPLVGLFFVYGIYFGLTEPVERAWVADLAPADLRGSGFGYYNGAIGIGALPANIAFGGIWAAFGPEAAFLFGASLAGLAALVLLGVPGQRAPADNGTSNRFLAP